MPSANYPVPDVFNNMSGHAPLPAISSTINGLALAKEPSQAHFPSTIPDHGSCWKKSRPYSDETASGKLGPEENGHSQTQTPSNLRHSDSSPWSSDENDSSDVEVRPNRAGAASTGDDDDDDDDEDEEGS